MTSSAYVELNNPAVVTWARETAGYTLDDVARRLGKRPEDVLAWETGESAPTYRQLKELAAYLKRPVSALFLPQPPASPPLPDDYRTLPGQSGRPFSPAALLAFRVLRNSLRELHELTADMEQPRQFALPSWQTEDDPEACGHRLREALGVAVAEQQGWRSDYAALDGWRVALFDRGVLVQLFAIAVEELRGFCIIAHGLAGIGISSKDAPSARVFSMAHELAHLCLRMPGVSGDSLLREAVDATPESAVERHCDAVAAALLLPTDDATVARSLSTAAGHFGREAAEVCARRFHVSKYVVARRLLDLGLVAPAGYWAEVSAWHAADSTRPPAGGGGNYISDRLSKVGKPFASVVLGALDRDLVTEVEAARILSVQPRHLDDIRARMVG